MTDWEFPVEAGHILQFVRALGGRDLDVGVREKPAVAPPTFAAAAEHRRPGSRLRPEPGTPWRRSGSGPGIAASAGGGHLHAEQHYEYHRPLLAGDRLRVRDGATRTWDRTNAAGDVLRFSKRTTHYLDANESPVVTERRVAVERLTTHDG